MKYTPRYKVIRVKFHYSIVKNDILFIVRVSSASSCSTLPKLHLTESGTLITEVKTKTYFFNHQC